MTRSCRRSTSSTPPAGCASSPGRPGLPDLAVELNLPGVHNVENALAAIAIGREVGVADAAIARALAEFQRRRPPLPALRRIRGRRGGTCTLIDDYGHHPVEMAATIAAVRGELSGPPAACSCSSRIATRRTRDLFEDFVRVLSTVDALVLADVYPAGEPPIVAADGRALARAVRVAGRVEPVFVETIADVPAAVRAIAARRRRRGHDGRRVDRAGAGAAAGAGGRSAEGVMHGRARVTSGLRGNADRRREPRALHELALRRAGRSTLYVPAGSRRPRVVPAGSCRADEPLTVIGLGSNLLVRDGGVRGTVVVVHARPRRRACLADGLIYAEAGVASPKVARFAANHGFAGAEFLAGIPGTVGGALAMNAGCYGGETWSHVARVEVLDAAPARSRSARRREYRIGYRSVHRADGSPPDGIFTAAWFAFPPGDAVAARARIRELLARRIAAQPLDLPNAGSVFRNPAGDHAARLIESCGLKGHAIGGAQVSAKHANFIVNPRGTASAADIEALIFARPAGRPRAHRRADLEPEVRIIGARAREGA